MNQKTLFFNVDMDDFAEVFSNEKVVSKLQGIFRKVLDEQKERKAESGNEYFTPQKICEEFKISKPTFYDWLKKGKFPIYKMGNRSFVKRSEFINAFHKVTVASC